jgi:hypothetical protein
MICNPPVAAQVAGDGVTRRRVQRPAGGGAIQPPSVPAPPEALAGERGDAVAEGE